LKVLHSFAFFTNKEDGQTPLSPLLLDEATGTLYGTTFYGGTGTRCGGVNGSCGTVFQVGIDGEDYKLLCQFPNKGPAAPQGQLALFHGDIYGTSYGRRQTVPRQTLHRLRHGVEADTLKRRLDFGKPYPDQVFTAVIFGADRGRFGTTTLQDKRVCVSGLIREDRGKPKIASTTRGSLPNEDHRTLAVGGP
jgi:hypothetical protein